MSISGRYWSGKVFVDDFNSEFADSYTVVGWRGGFEHKIGGWKLREFLRVDNLFDKHYVGAVIIGDSNRRFYAPAPERNYLGGVTAAYQF